MLVLLVVGRRGSGCGRVSDRCSGSEGARGCGNGSGSAIGSGSSSSCSSSSSNSSGNSSSKVVAAVTIIAAGKETDCSTCSRGSRNAVVSGVLTVTLKGKLPPSRDTSPISSEMRLVSCDRILGSHETRLFSLETSLISRETSLVSREWPQQTVSSFKQVLKRLCSETIGCRRDPYISETQRSEKEFVAQSRRIISRIGCEVTNEIFAN